MRLLFGKHFHGGNSSVVYGGTSSTSDTSVRAKMSNHSGDRDSIRAGIHDPLLYEANNPMSKDRRKFAIICVFDLVLITILWLISAVTKGNDWPQIFLDEINIFKAEFFDRSLFDIVILGVLRTTILLIFYAGLRVDHWFPVACTTSISTIFLVVKILFFFKKNHEGLAQVVLLASLSVAWFELWVVPFRVLSRERYAQDNQFIASPHSSVPTSSSRSNRRPVNRRRMIATAHPPTEDEFRTAFDYTTDEERSPQIALNPVINLSGYGYVIRHDAYLALDETYRQVMDMYNEISTWKRMNKSSPEVLNRDNCFYVRCELEYEPRIVFLAAWRDVEYWNPQVVRIDYLYKFDNERDIIHSESSPALGGYVASRHFIDIRRVIHDSQADSYTCVYVSIPTQNNPEELSGGSIRGFNGPNLVRITKIGDNKTLFEWLMNTDVRTQIPKTLIRRGTVSFLSQYPKLMAKFISDRLDLYTSQIV